MWWEISANERRETQTNAGVLCCCSCYTSPLYGRPTQRTALTPFSLALFETHLSQIPTGDIASVDGTSLDFQETTNLGEAIRASNLDFFVVGIDDCLVHTGTSENGVAEVMN